MATFVMDDCAAEMAGSEDDSTAASPWLDADELALEAAGGQYLRGEDKKVSLQISEQCRMGDADVEDPAAASSTEDDIAPQVGLGEVDELEDA